MNLEISKYLDTPFLEHGRTFAGCDCWGLVRLFYFCEYNILLPDLQGYKNTRDYPALAGLVENEQSSGEWFRVKQERPSDIVLFSIGGYLCHVGVVMSNKKMMHSFEANETACLERYNNMRWEKRIHGFYRHKQLAAGGH